MKIVLLAFTLLVSNAFAESLKLSCVDEMQGLPTRTAVFNSEIPSLTGSDQLPGNGMDYLSLAGACGVPQGFATNCHGGMQSVGGSPGYAFTCKNGINGQIIYYAPDTIEFDCSGPGVLYESAMYYGCKAEQ